MELVRNVRVRVIALHRHFLKKSKVELFKTFESYCIPLHSFRIVRHGQWIEDNPLCDSDMQLHLMDVKV
jgi:hypothetical protein